MLKTFKCLQCDSTFDRASQLDYHRRSLHLGERSQICQICGKGFFRKADLRTHLNIHLGTNFHICEICGRKFSHISNLIRHCRMHTGIKPYSCSICEKNFTQMSSLARHKQMIHGIPKDVAQQYYNSSLISNRSRFSSQASKENKTIGNNEESRFHEASYVEPKHISQNTRDSDVKSETIPNQRDVDMDNKACLFETIICVTSKQFEEGNLAENESTNRSPQDQFAEIEERFGATDLSTNNTIVSNSPQDIVNNYEIQSKDSITYLHQLDKNIVAFLSRDREFSVESETQSDESILRSNDSDICISREICKESSIDSVRDSLNMETDLQACNSSEVLTDQKFLHKQVSKEIISESKKCNKLLSDDDNQLYIELSNSGMLKFDEPRYCNSTNLAGANIIHATKSHHSESITANEVISTSDAMQNQEGLLHNEENVESFSNACNIVSNNEEPMLRLVQTETGEQFYEFIISNLVEKMQNASCTKDLEDTIEDPSNTFRDDEKINSTSKESEKNDQMEHQQALDGLVDMNNEFNYAQFDFPREEKSCAVLSHGESEHFVQNSKADECVGSMQEKSMQVYNSGNLELLESESHVDFDKYVETNLEAFERLNYENCNERFLEFVEVADIGMESSGYKELSMVRLIPNDGEHLLELLQDSQTDQEVTRDFAPANNFKDCANILQDSNKIAECPKSKIDFFTYVEDNVPLGENVNSSRGTENIEGRIDSGDHLPTNVMTEDASNKNCGKTLEESKKSKTISKKFQCSVCKKAFSTAYNYKQHIGIHFTDQQKFHCKDCGVSFAWKSTLNKHIANNHSSDGPQKFVCEICPKVYSTLSQVNEHVKRDHLKQRNHVCLHCGKSFFKKFDLKTHSRTHTNERPYVCRVCGKRFHHQSHIIRHERTHSGERPYTCDICQRTFMQPSSLKAHKQKHQQIRMDFLDYQIDEDDPVALVTL
ncbi:PREDICTED: zinc finger protein 226-like [Vollenhovia emeryi]|uniref:zinc finger protein 226-like n=1 Tax=Vollenhovia emeryi TaxID=411798 RepID=UPI0005F3CB88|nr:PREDICTED: zinc finger protein 226-like [Vollenhovia emeryi]